MSNDDSERERILKKINDLLARSLSSSYEEEARTSAVALAQLLKKHNVQFTLPFPTFPNGSSEPSPTSYPSPPPRPSRNRHPRQGWPSSSSIHDEWDAWRAKKSSEDAAVDEISKRAAMEEEKRRREEAEKQEERNASDEREKSRCTSDGESYIPEWDPRWVSNIGKGPSAKAQRKKAGNVDSNGEDEYMSPAEKVSNQYDILISAKYSSMCVFCHEEIEKGNRIYYMKRKHESVHQGCYLSYKKNHTYG